MLSNLLLAYASTAAVVIVGIVALLVGFAGSYILINVMFHSVRGFFSESSHDL